MVPYSKPPKTFSQQVALLEARGLTIEDRALAEETLARINYYRLSAYWHPFKRADDTFESGASFSQAVDYYEFDRALRSAVMRMLEQVEIHLRCAISYQIAHTHGPMAHEDPNLFERSFEHESWLRDLHEETRRSREVFVRHFQGKYEGFPALPVWMASELMSFGTLSRLFKGLLRQDQRAIAGVMGIHPTVLASWMHTLVYVRNLCAHHSRLWNRHLAIAPFIPKHDPRWIGPLVPDANSVFCVLCMLRQLSLDYPQSDGWGLQLFRLLESIDSEPGRLTAMGVPVGWRAHPLWVF
jgi:abortive infection bacteriophage resistance protein